MVGVPVVETGLLIYKISVLTVILYPINRTPPLSDAGVLGSSHNYAQDLSVTRNLHKIIQL